MTSVLTAERAEALKLAPTPMELRSELSDIPTRAIETIGGIATKSEAAPTYSYSVIYDNKGNIAGASSEYFDPSDSTRVTTEFDKNGEELTKRVIRPGQEVRYEGGVLRYRHQSGWGGNYTTKWFDAKGELERSTSVDTDANTLTVSLHKNGTIGPVDLVYKYRGAGGWVS